MRPNVDLAVLVSEGLFEAGRDVPFRLQSAQTLLSGCLSNSRRARVFASVVFLSWGAIAGRWESGVRCVCL